MLPQILYDKDGVVIRLDENGDVRGNNAAYRPGNETILQQIRLSRLNDMALAHAAVAVAEQTPAAVRETCPECLRPTEPVAPATPKVELREFTFRYWTKSDGQGHQEITAENREQALSVLWHLDGEYIDKVWAD